MTFFLFEDEQEMPERLLNEEGKHFETCKQCGESLLEPPRTYTLEKVFKRYPNVDKPQVLFEYAVCDDCSGEMRDDFSAESAEKLQAYFKERVITGATSNSDLKAEDRLDRCVVTRKMLDEEQEFAIVARGFGKSMLQSHYPFAISLTAMDEMAELLSPQTRDLLDDFVERNFTGPPEFEVVPPDGKWVLV
jgi:hypothetical protein